MNTTEAPTLCTSNSTLQIGSMVQIQHMLLISIRDVLIRIPFNIRETGNKWAALNERVAKVSNYLIEKNFLLDSIESALSYYEAQTVTKEVMILEQEVFEQAQDKQMHTEAEAYIERLQSLDSEIGSAIGASKSVQPNPNEFFAKFNILGANTQTLCNNQLASSLMDKEAVVKMAAINVSTYQSLVEVAKKLSHWALRLEQSTKKVEDLVFVVMEKHVNAINNIITRVQLFVESISSRLNMMISYIIGQVKFDAAPPRPS
jgi:hypothetical protein